jgi:hypothetical protein
MRRPWLPALVVSLAALPAASDQTEDALRSALVGKYVTVKIDMPASHKGVDLRFDKEQPFNMSEHFSRLKEFDSAIREGDRVPITYVKLKDDMIEIHLAGGGFNWISDKTTQSFSGSSKSSRESDLEKRIKTETDRQRKREMQDELDDLRRQRERRDDRRRREVEEYNVMASERDHNKAMRSGSRFNLRFKKNVPQGALSADGVMDYLTKWASTSSGSAPRGGSNPAPRSGDDTLDWLRKGLLRDDVNKRLGRARSEGSCKSGDSQSDCRMATYASGDDEVEVTYVEDVVVKFTIRRR